MLRGNGDPVLGPGAWGLGPVCLSHSVAVGTCIVLNEGQRRRDRLRLEPNVTKQAREGVAVAATPIYSAMVPEPGRRREKKKGNQSIIILYPFHLHLCFAKFLASNPPILALSAASAHFLPKPAPGIIKTSQPASQAKRRSSKARPGTPPSTIISYPLHLRSPSAPTLLSPSPPNPDGTPSPRVSRPLQAERQSIRIDPPSLAIVDPHQPLLPRRRSLPTASLAVHPPPPTASSPSPLHLVATSSPPTLSTFPRTLSIPTVRPHPLHCSSPVATSGLCLRRPRSPSFSALASRCA
ncbi:hypothetical protein IWX50DRAFT_24176 [Phyllosticta citricarpa]